MLNLGIPSEIHYETGLWVWRSRIDPGLARDFADETREWLQLVKPGGLPEDETYFRGILANQLDHNDRPATTQMLGQLGATTAGYGINFIHRPPGKADGLHKDTRGLLYEDSCDVNVVHGDDGAAVDIAPFATSASEAQGGESSLVVVHFSAGDVARHTKPWLFHQGRNPTDVPQISAAIRELPTSGDRFGRSPYPRVA
jgi:hypothetical protein